MERRWWTETVTVSAWLLIASACLDCSSSTPKMSPLEAGTGDVPTTDAEVTPIVSTPDADAAPVVVDAGDDGGTDGDDGRGDDGAGPRAPTIAAVSPPEVFPGDEFTVEGTDLAPSPRGILGDLTLTPIRATASALTFKVPADIMLTGCARTLSLAVQTEVGLSTPASLLVQDPGPSLSPAIPKAIPAGTTLLLKGCNLASASATLDDVSLPVSAATSISASITVPRDAKVGTHLLKISTPKGSTQYQTDVLPPTPQIVDTDLPTVGPNGVLFVTTDATSPSLVAKVRIGSTAIDASDPAVVKWPTQTGSPSTRRLAIKIPGTQPAGAVDLSLIGSSGESLPFRVTVVAPAPAAPPAVAAIVINPLGAADGDTFPFGTTTPFFLAEPGVNMAMVNWYYDLNFRDPGRNTPGYICTGHGTINGVEHHTHYSVRTGEILQNSCTPGPTQDCHPLSGDYVLSLTENRVTLTIDRTSTGGTVETYEGGWVREDGRPALKGATNYLVLRSKRTGIQLSIQHRMTSLCNDSYY